MLKFDQNYDLISRFIINKFVCDVRIPYLYILHQPGTPRGKILLAGTLPEWPARGRSFAAPRKPSYVLYAENAARSRRRHYHRRRCWIWWRKRIKTAQRLAGSLAQTVRHPPADCAYGAIFVLWLRHMFANRHRQRRFVESPSSRPLNYSQFHSVARFNILEE